MTALLEAKNLTVTFDTLRGPLRAIDGIDFSISAGETLGIVGESGSGKSVTSLAIMGLLPNNARLNADHLRFQGRDLMSMPEKERARLRGAAISMIFQDPMTSLNPCYTVEFQIAEALRAHSELGRKNLRARVVELLEQVGIPDPTSRLHAYPHQLSGGMSQRVMIAMAVACSPQLLIADEPTTALDVTIQAQILSLLRDLREKRQMGLILITHDIGVVAENAKKIIVMYAGQIVEFGDTREVIQSPCHPYTAALLASLPNEDQAFRSKLSSLSGIVPDLTQRPNGCQLHPRCHFADERCKTTMPQDEWLGDRRVKCFKPIGSVGKLSMIEALV